MMVINVLKESGLLPNDCLFDKGIIFHEIMKDQSDIITMTYRHNDEMGPV